MNCPKCLSLLNDYVDRQLASADARSVETHLAQCESCRRHLQALRGLLEDARKLPAAIPPPRDLWSGIAAEVERTDFENSGRRVEFSAGGVVRWIAPLAIAASVALLATFTERSGSGPAWGVATLAGAPQIDAKNVPPDASFRVGQWLETDGNSRAKVAVGSIGEVTVDPNSRLRLTRVAAYDHRLELTRGTLRALIWAPPRLFFVDTPSATAVDLGCAYTLAVDDHGDGELHVTTGYVALEHGGRESIIPARAMCLTRRGAGPGTPFVEDAPRPLREALTRFDFERDPTKRIVPEILVHARPEDALTLWHLLARTQGTERIAVFDTLVKFEALPAGVTRQGILAGDATMRRAWGRELGFGTF